MNSWLKSLKSQPGEQFAGGGKAQLSLMTTRGTDVMCAEQVLAKCGRE